MRKRASAAYDLVNNRMIVYGDDNQSVTQGFKRQFRLDVVERQRLGRLTSLEELKLDRLVSAFDSVHNRMVIFGCWRALMVFRARRRE